MAPIYAKSKHIASLTYIISHGQRRCFPHKGKVRTLPGKTMRDYHSNVGPMRYTGFANVHYVIFWTIVCEFIMITQSLLRKNAHTIGQMKLPTFTG